MATLNPVQLVLPKKKPRAGGTGYTPTFNPQNAVLSVPQYRDHLQDVFVTRQGQDSRTLLNTLFVHDPDVSAAVHAYLTIAEAAKLVVVAYDENEQLSREGIELAQRILANLTNVWDYTLGYNHKPGLHQLTSDFRYTALLRGMTAAELVFDKVMVPSELRLIDPASLEWREAKAGVYKPVQKPTGANVEINLDLPTFFTSRFHQNPTNIYTFSNFVSVINSMAARAQVINELVRIMRFVGYPRLDVEVLEDIVANNAPATMRNDPVKLREFVEAEVSKVRSQINAIASSSQALVHSSSVKARIINDKNPASGLDISNVIDILDAQNQAALKVMPAVVGKSDTTGGVAGTEARLFAMGADSLNWVVAHQLSQPLTLAARLAGFAGRVEVRFEPIELRATLELEPHLTMRAARLKQDLSLGLISDDEYHLEMYGRVAPEGTPELAGTSFLTPNAGEAEVDVGEVSPNADPMGRSLAPEGGKSAKSNTTKSGEA